MNKVSGKTTVICGFLLLSCLETFAQNPDFHIYLGFGQSNMAGAGTIEAQDRTVDSRFQMMAPQDCPSLNRLIGKWYNAIPPLWGCPAGGLGPCDYFGRTMVQNLPSTIKVGVVVVGIPGCDIRLFDKTNSAGLEAYTYNYIPAKYNKSAYAWLVDLAKLAQKDGVIKGFLLHQGETMPDAAKWPGQVKAVYDSLISDLKLDPSKTPLLAGEMLYANMGGACGSHNTTVAKLPGVIPNSYVISASELAGKDQFHFNSEGNRIFGRRYADKMKTLLDPVSSRDTDNPVPRKRSGVMGIRNSPSGSAVMQIRQEGDFRYRIINIYGAVMEAGKGRGLLTVGANQLPGMYFLSVEHKTGTVVEKFFTR